MRFCRLIGILGILLCSLVQGVWSSENSVKVLVGTQCLNLSPAPVWEQNECWIPLAHTIHLGLELELVEDAQFAQLNHSPDKKVPVQILSLTDAGGKSVKMPCVPLRELARVAGGATRWEESERTLQVRAILQAIAWNQDALALNTTLPAAAMVTTLREPNRIVIDLIGCQLPSQPLTTAGSHPDVQGVRTAQYDPNTVRVVLDLKKPIIPATGLKQAQMRHQIILSEQTAQTPEELPLTTPNIKPPKPETFKPPVIEKKTDSTIARFQVPPTVKPKVSFAEEPIRVEMVLPGTLHESLEQEAESPNDHIQRLRAIPLEGGLVRVVLELGRALGVKVLNRQNELAIVVNKPRNSGGTLSQKVITIDPGHGGKQPGARAVHKGKTVYEKDIVMSVSNKVLEYLNDKGSNVIMTRAEDKQVGLYDRTDMANDANAHFFVSLHCDSNARPNSASGTTIYYHGDDADSRALAQAILSEIVKVSGLPSKGVRSDKVLYDTGLAVLRTSRMPAVLIEMGYLNHDGDRAKLLDPQFQDRIAAAIARGIQKYVEGN
ncbi:MAG: N-acetylmuramoyl-L-alanine amidase [Fimbriimonadia bacterium]|nr:N-acetylmuramoyl-L-alanine amidase [Fimbriimonadia bacterium]